MKGIQERFARLGVIAAILRNGEGRKRYDFFYKNGVPKWRGTGYYYSRFRPGLGVRPFPAVLAARPPVTDVMVTQTVFTFLVLVTSGMHYLVQRVQYKSDLARVERFVRDAKAAAWGPKMIPVDGSRKVRIALGGPPRYDEDGNPVNARAIDMVVEGSGQVYIVRRCPVFRLGIEGS